MNFLNGSFRIGRLFDITIRVHILFLIWIGYRLIAARGAWQSEFVFLGMLFGIVFVHELGHCFGARAVGGDAHNIMLWPLGGLAFAQAPMRPWPQFVTVAAGPLVNVLFCILSAAVLIVATNDIGVVRPNPFNATHLSMLAPTWQQYVALFYWVNLILLCFNLLPIYPMDGGQLFQAIIWPFVGLQRATLIACYVGIAGCVMLGIWGLQGGGGILVFIAIFGGFTCFQRLKMAQYGMIVQDSPYTDSMGRPLRRGGTFWSRVFKTSRRSRPDTRVHTGAPRAPTNPNPGAWEEKQAERQRLEAELDRILKKVSEQGIHSLSYVERQTLERATRERQARERDFQRQNKL